MEYEGDTFDLDDGDVVIAAITSCTNTSNPDVMVGAGLVARKARALASSQAVGEDVLGPGLQGRHRLPRQGQSHRRPRGVGFYLVGYGCTTCIGNSGPLPRSDQRSDQRARSRGHLGAVGQPQLRGTHLPDVRANYLAQPPLVVAYALAGTVDIDLTTEPLGQDSDGNDVFLRDIWPSQAEIDRDRRSLRHQRPVPSTSTASVQGSDEWRAVASRTSDLFDWDPSSTYVQEPPFFMDSRPGVEPLAPIEGAGSCSSWAIRSPPITSARPVRSPRHPAGKYLTEQGVERRCSTATAHAAATTG